MMRRLKLITGAVFALLTFAFGGGALLGSALFGCYKFSRWANASEHCADCGGTRAVSIILIVLFSVAIISFFISKTAYVSAGESFVKLPPQVTGLFSRGYWKIGILISVIVFAFGLIW